jgi:hypothetical protein
MKKPDVAFVMWRVMGVLGTETGENIADVKRRMMAWEHRVVRKKLQYPFRIRKNMRVVGIYLSLR